MFMSSFVAGRNDAAELYDDRDNLKSTTTTSYAAAASAIGMPAGTWADGEPDKELTQRQTPKSPHG
jgi:hypothetical protein